jgi:hypothetical protein
MFVFVIFIDSEYPFVVWYVFMPWWISGIVENICKPIDILNIFLVIIINSIVF